MEKKDEKIIKNSNNEEKKVKKSQSNTKKSSEIANKKKETKKVVKNSITKDNHKTNTSKKPNVKNTTKESTKKNAQSKNKDEANLETKKSVKKVPNNTSESTTKSETNKSQAISKEEVSELTPQTNKKEQAKLTKTENELDKKIVDVSKSEINKKNTEKISKEIFGFKEIFGIIIITALVGFFVGTLVRSNKADSKLSNYDKELLTNYHDILNHYYKDIDARDLVKYATKGMIASLGDPYSTYIDADAIDDFNIDIYGEYEGIGIEMTYNDEYEPFILTVFPNSPAEKSGLQVGDILVYINDTSVISKSLDEIKEIISNFEDNEFKLVVQRDGEGYEATLKRDKIVIESVNEKIYERNNQKIGYLGLNNFAKNSDEQFNEKLKELEKQKIDSLIIDLRYNSGGELETVHNIVSLFIKKGETIYQLKEKDKITKYYSDNEETRNYKIVVLTNEASASASELMTGALKEIYGATVIGTKTFGKGTGQQVVTLENGEKYKFTTKEWLTAKGNSINEVGINPTIEVEQSEEYNEEPTEENDAQLNAALEFLGK